MGIIVGFDEWQAATISRMTAENPMVTCRACDGDGESECDCGCEHCEHFDECGVCEGDGKVRFSNSRISSLNHKDYFLAVMPDIKKFCIWTGRDFLSEAGGFIKSLDYRYDQLRFMRPNL
jgi:hypothetical protein